MCSLVTICSTDLPKCPANSNLALEALTGFCVAESMQKESILALCIVILLSQYSEQMISLPNISLPTSISITRVSPSKRFLTLVDKCITLSCAEESMQSILCSSFLNPGIPCNLVGPWFLGLRQALSECGGMETLEKFIVKTRPTIAPL